MACDMPLCPFSGATAMMRPGGAPVSIRLRKPFAFTPSSLVRNIRGFVIKVISNVNTKIAKTMRFRVRNGTDLPVCVQKELFLKGKHYLCTHKVQESLMRTQEPVIFPLIINKQSNGQFNQNRRGLDVGREWRFLRSRAGDTITVTYKIVEGNKERLQSFRGTVIKLRAVG